MVEVPLTEGEDQALHRLPTLKCNLCILSACFFLDSCPINNGSLWWTDRKRAGPHRGWITMDSSSSVHPTELWVMNRGFWGSLSFPLTPPVCSSSVLVLEGQINMFSAWGCALPLAQACAPWGSDCCCGLRSLRQSACCPAPCQQCPVLHKHH